METTREQSCDEMVTARLLPAPVDARSLVTIAETLTGPGRVSYALGVLDGGRLELRVSRLLDQRRRLGPQVSALASTAATALLVVIAAVTSTFSLSASQSFPESAAAAAATQGRVIGMWRGNWTEVLVPKFKADVDSSPIWLQFRTENGHVVGTVPTYSLSSRPIVSATTPIPSTIPGRVPITSLDVSVPSGLKA